MNRDLYRHDSASGRVRPTHFYRTLGISALAAMGCLSVAANAAIQTDLGVDYQASGFYVQSESFDTPTSELDPETTPDDDDNGFAHFLRIQADFKHEETGVSAHTRVELAGDRWTGDARNYTTTGARAFNPSNNGDNVRLDLGFVQVPLPFGLLRVGRQESNWSNCFLTCDDRRDRILFLTEVAGVSLITLYDRRQDNAAFQDVDNGNQVVFGAVAPFGESGWELGFLYVHYFDSYDGDLVDEDPLISGVDADGNPIPVEGSTGARDVYAVSNANLLSPYLNGSAGPLDIEFGVNYFRDSNVENNATPEGGDIYSGNALSEYVRVGADVGLFELKAQFLGTQNGGLVSSGFDTFSSLINSSPESTTNPTSVFRIGGFSGRKGFDQSLYIGSVTANVTPKLALRGSVGYMDLDYSDSIVFEGQSDGSMVYDLQASYQINSAVRTWATLGMLEENDVGTLSGNSLVGALPNGGSFASDRVVAGSLNLGVEF